MVKLRLTLLKCQSFSTIFEQENSAHCSPKFNFWTKIHGLKSKVGNLLGILKL